MQEIKLRTSWEKHFLVRKELCGCDGYLSGVAAGFCLSATSMTADIGQNIVLPSESRAISGSTFQISGQLTTQFILKFQIRPKRFSVKRKEMEIQKPMLHF